MHGIFPTHNKYYLAQEIFPHLSRAEKKEVYFPDKKTKRAPSLGRKVKDEEEDALPVKIKHK